MLDFGQMFSSMSGWFKQKQLRVGINLIVTLGLLWALYRQFFVVNDFQVLLLDFRQNLSQSSILQLSLVCLLMPINLFLETYKLRLPIPRRLLPSWRSSFGQVCAGIAVGLWTPARLGEFAGRLAQSKRDQRKAILSSTLIGAIAQWIPLLLGGGLALSYWRNIVLKLYDPQDGAYEFINQALRGGWGAWLAGLSTGVGIALLIVYWNSELLIKLLRKSSIITKFRSSRIATSMRVVRHSTSHRAGFLRKSEIRPSKGGGITETLLLSRFRLLSASLLRYGIYLFQMAIAFVSLGLNVEIDSAVIGTASALLVHGFLPLPSTLQVLARVQIIVLLFSFANPNEVSITAASLFIFALNLGLPALYGWFFIVQKNVKIE